MKTALIVGGGFAGCAAAHQLLLKGDWDVIIAERSANLGAGVRTMWHGSHPFTFGPRHFLTQRQDVWDYMDALVPLRRLDGHQFITYVESDAAFYNYPIHYDDIDRMPDRDQIHAEFMVSNPSGATNLEEYWIGSVGPTLYRKFIDGYSRKMWQITDNGKIDDFAWSPKGVTIKSGPRAAWDTALSGYPYAPNGYDDYFAKATAGAAVVLDADVWVLDLQRKYIKINDDICQPNLVVWTASPDDIWDKVPHGLPYIGREFHALVLPIKQVLPDDVYFTYYAGSEQVSRIVEYKKFTQHQSPHSLIGIEIPRRNGRRDYPLPMKRYQKIARRYQDEVPQDWFFMGRLGSYRYGIDMAAAVEQAFELGKQIDSGAGRGVLGERWK